MPRLLTIPLACLALSACNPPHMWTEPIYYDTVIIQQAAGPPLYRLPTREVCYDKWGRELSSREFQARGYRFEYGDHCWEVGVDPRPLGTGRRRVR